MIIIFVSCESRKDARLLANYLIDNHIAACVNVFPVDSYYWWKLKKVNYKEYELIIKTKKEKFSKVEQAISKLLPYEIPQIVAVEAANVNKSYLEWLNMEITEKWT